MYDEKSNADLWWSDVKGRLIRAEPQSGCHQVDWISAGLMGSAVGLGGLVHFR